MDNKKFTTIIVITPKDFPRLSKHYKRLVNNMPSERLLFVSGAAIENELKKADLGDNVAFIDENELLTFDEVNNCMAQHLKDILGNDPVPRAATGWYYQQFLKMQYAYICQDEYYMTWDGDTIPCKPFSMFQEGSNSPYLDMKQEYHALYFETLEKLLPGLKKCIGRSFISEHMLFNTAIMKELIAKIEANDNIPGTKFWEKIIHAISPESICDSGFSEFETYGTYVAINHTDLYKLREWHSFRLAGEFFDPETISERDYNWLAKDFFAISFEKNQYVREDNKNLFDNPKYQEKLSARKMLEIAQEEFNGGYIEIWGDYTGNQVYDPLASASKSKENITGTNGVFSLASNIPEDIFFDRLGDIKYKTNLNQAYLCYENAEFLCNDKERKELYKQKKENLLKTNLVTVRKAAICIVSYNCKSYMEECIRSIRFHCAPGSYSIVVTDNNSTDSVRDYLLSISDNITLVLSDENLGFPAGSNLCIQYSEKDQDIFLLNNDTRMTHNALFFLRMGLYENDSIGATGCMGSFAGNDQMVDLHYSKAEDYMQYAKSVNVYLDNPLEEKSRLCGFAMMIKRSVIDEVGVLDEAFSPGYFEDDDLSLRISEKGYKLMVVHNSFIYHKGSESFNNKNNIVHKTINETLSRNYQYIQNKYGFNAIKDACIQNSEKDLFASISHKPGDSFTFLEINAKAGNFLSALSYSYPFAKIYGTVINEKQAKYFVKNIPAIICNPINDKLPFAKHYFDYIVVNVDPEDSLSIITPEQAKEYLASFVKENGKLLYIVNE